MRDREKILRLSLFMALASIILIGVGVFIAFGAFAKEPYTVSERTLYRITRNSEFNLTFLLEPNEIYEENAIQLGGSTSVYLSLVRMLVVNYTYLVSQGSANGVINISVLLVHPEGWSKRYFETSIRVNGSSSASKLFQLNMSDVVDLMTRLSKQVKARYDTFTIRISATADMILSYQQYAREDMLSHSVDLNVLVGYNQIKFSGNQSMQNVFEEKKKIVEIVRLMGVDVDTARGISLLLASGGVALMLVSIYLRRSIKKPERPEEILESRYSQAIVEISNPRGHVGRSIVYVEKPEELIKLSRLLERPVLKECYSDNMCEYYIVDRDIVYMLKTGGEEHEKVEHRVS
ncbi:MAG: DUF5305 family protein [Sulfolobales archaeon]